MARPYFRQVPDFDYVSRDKDKQYISEYVPVKNLFKKGKLREDIFGNLAFFEKYTIRGDERPDNVAYKFYRDETLDWVILLANNILNIQSEWPMTQNTFDKIMLERYGSYESLYSGIHHHETNEIRNSSGAVVLRSGIKISPTWKTNGNFIETVGSKINSISSGDGITPSNIVTVTMVNTIPGLAQGDQITVNNMTETEYNGRYRVKELISYTVINDLQYVTSFTYELPYTPNVATPSLANPRQEEILFTIPETSEIPANSYYYEYWDDNLGYTVQVPSTSFVREVTNFEYEMAEENKRRNIYILKPRYLSVVFNDMDDIMPYKKGSTQYVSATLKKGDNIKLYD